MPDVTIDNPFLRVYDKVFSLLFEGEDNPLANMIQPGNRISFGSVNADNRSPSKDRPTTADVPELMLIDEGGNLNLHANSSGAKYIQNLSMYVSTGDFRYGRYASCINWFIACNLGSWRSELTSITWCGIPVVKNIDIIPVQIGESNPERTRMPNGWSCIWRLNIELRIPSENLIPAEVLTA